MATTESQTLALSQGNTQLEQFLILAKNTTGKATVAVIMQVLKHKSIFVFAELLDLPCVQQLRGTEQEPWLRVLELFSYGTYQQYKARQNEFPPLQEKHIVKLKQLSFVSCASSSSVLRYKDLMDALDVSSVRALEDLVISCVYNGLVRGKLNQREGKFTVQWVMGRDLRPGELEEIMQKLKGWRESCQKLVEALDVNNSLVQRFIKEDKEMQAKLDLKLETVKGEVKKNAEAALGDADALRDGSRQSRPNQFDLSTPKRIASRSDYRGAKSTGRRG